MKWWNKTKTFLQEVRVEIGKCYFPGQKEVISTTIVVLVTSAIFALFLYISDIVIIKATEAIFRLSA
jgi:preprotein translocase subunit SecE